MKNYEYVCEKEWKPVKKEILEILHELQDEVRNKTTFDISFVGSVKYNLITREVNGNKGFDLDVQCLINNDLKADDAFNSFKQAFDRIIVDYSFDYPQKYENVFVLKFKDKKNSKIVYSCDIAIMKKCNDGRKQILRKSDNNHHKWEFQSKDYVQVEQLINKIKKKKLWFKFRKKYLDEKCKQSGKSSRTLLIETLNSFLQNLK